jgi:putative restriction endonuclease
LADDEKAKQGSAQDASAEEIHAQRVQTQGANSLLAGPRQLSKELIVGELYTREHLKAILETSDATINTGIFLPKGYSSVLLFVTEHKTADRTQFVDKLSGDVLHWQGQRAGLKDYLIEQHVQRGLELLVFYRTKKYEHPRAAFRYEGCFLYVGHSGREPTDFVLHREQPYLVGEPVDEAPSFDPTDEADGRRRIMAEVTRRQGQKQFRQALMNAYAGRCAVTSCRVVPVLEAAHILPYRGPHTNHVTNGLLLRADIHTLYDLGMVAVAEDYRVLVAPALHGTQYVELHGRPLLLPEDDAQRPNLEALRIQRERAGF